MTRPKRGDEPINVTKQKLLRLLTKEDALKKRVQTLRQEVLEAEIDEVLHNDEGGRARHRARQGAPRVQVYPA